MDGRATTKQLSLQHSIPPIPNPGPGAAAWLRSFAGFSWLAYGAGGSVVIRSAPSPSAGGDNSASAFFQQVVSLSRGSESSQALAKQAVLDGDRVKGEVGNSRKSDEEGGTNVECLAWAPQGAEQQGLLAVVCGFAVHILAPQNSEGSSPTDLPLFWRPVARLHHSSPVHAVAWTHSGDGLLSAGSEVAMWRPVRVPLGSAASPEPAWQRLWTGNPRDGPQLLTATNQNADSLSATAQGPPTISGESLTLFMQNGLGQERADAGTGGDSRRKSGRRAWGRPTETGHATVWWYHPKPADAKAGLQRSKSQESAALANEMRQSRLAAANGTQAAGTETRHHSHHRPADEAELDHDQELHAVVLPHPGQVLQLQWRPSQGLRDSPSSSKRQVLLTSCEDGIVRLWLEVEIKRSRQVAGSDTPLARGPPRFYVGAIFEACASSVPTGPSIPGCIYWAEESLAQRSGGASKEERLADVAGCEWLVGVRADGSVGLWAVHCLDDLHPPRTPRVSKWDESKGLLRAQGGPPDEVDKSASARWQPSMLSCAIQRPEGAQGGPPTAVELCERVSLGVFRWARIWPPVSAIGGGGGHIVGGNEGPKSSGRKTWGFAMEDVRLFGHSGGVRQVAVHPSPAAAVAATLDSTGEVLLWDLSAVSVESLAAPGVPGPFGILGSALKAWQKLDSPDKAGRRYRAVQWVGGGMDQPASVQWLLALCEEGIDVWQIVGGKEGSAKLSLLTSLAYPEKKAPTALEDLRVLPIPTSVFEESKDSDSGRVSGVRCHVVAKGDAGRVLLGWQLEIRGQENAYKVRVSGWWVESERSEVEGMESENDVAETVVEARLIAWREFEDEEAVASLDVAENIWSLLEGDKENDTEERGRDEKRRGPCDFVTAHDDGSVRFWVVAGEEGKVDQPSDATWHLAGWTRVSNKCALEVVSVAPGGGRIAVVIRQQPEKQQGGDLPAKRVQIWEGESCLGVGGSFTLEGELEFPAGGSGLELQWAEACNGQLLLAIASCQKLQVFAQGHSPRRDPESGSPDAAVQTLSGGWIPIAEADSPFERFGGFAWGRQLSLVVSTGAQLHVRGPWLTATPSVSTLPLPPPEVAAPTNAPISRGTYKGGSYSQLSLSPSPSAGSLPQLGLYSNSVPSLSSLLTPSSSYGSLQGAEQKPLQKAAPDDDVSTLLEVAGGMGAPLQDYHPRVLFHYMFEGNKKKARMCLRHLAAGLRCATSAKGSGGLGGPQPFGRMRLSELVSLDQAPELSRLPSRRGSAVGASTGKFGGPGVGEKEKDKYASLMSSTWVDEEPGGEGTASGSKPYEYVARGANELFTKAEAEALSEALAMSVDVQGLTSDERVQLLAIIDALAELDGGSGNPRLALDAPAERFRMATRASTLAASRKRGRSAGTADITLPSMQMAWVLHSDTKEALLDACLPDPPSWPAMKALGVGFWHTNVTDLRARIEKAARAQFMEKKDPKDCALLYLALDRKTVLTGLFKLSRDEKDKKLYEFLGRDFTQDQHKAAALKNSYVLMGQHRHELAAAFFLLGGALDEAAGVCGKNLRDPQLALLVCRLKEGADGAVGRELLKKEILPSARGSGDAWLASMLLWSLGMKIEALREVAGAGPNSDSGTPSAPILDPEVGDYCALLAGKPALQQGPHAIEASEIVKRATVRAAYAYDRAGLQLQALEHLPADINPETSPKPEAPKSQPQPSASKSFAPSASLESGTFSWGGGFAAAGGGGNGTASATSAASSNPWAFGATTTSASADGGPKKESNPWAFGAVSNEAETPKPQTPAESQNPWSFGSSLTTETETPKPSAAATKPNPWAFGASFSSTAEAEAPETSKPPPATSANPWSFGSSFAPSDESAETSKPQPAVKPNPWAVDSSFTSFRDSETESSAKPPPKSSANPWTFGGVDDAEAAPSAPPAAKPSNPLSFVSLGEEESVETVEDASTGPLKGARIGDGWLGEQVVIGVRYGMRHRLTSQVVSPLLQQQASWHAASASVSEVQEQQSEEELSEDLTLAIDRWRIDPQKLSLALASLAYTHSRWSAFCQLACSTSIASPMKITASGLDLAALGRAFFAGPEDVAPVASSIVRALVEVLPRVISQLALSSGGAAPVRSPLPRQQLREVLRMAAELQNLMAAIPTAEGREDGSRRASEVVAFLLFLTAAWFGKRTQGLLALLRPLLAGAWMPIALPSGAAEIGPWFEGRVEKLSAVTLRAKGKGLDKAGVSSEADKAAPSRDPLPAKHLVVSQADTWRILSTCLWSQVLGSIRKQLSSPKPPDIQSDRPLGSPQLTESHPDRPSGDRPQSVHWNPPSQEQSPSLSPYSTSPPASPPGGPKHPANVLPGVGGGIAGAGGIYSRGPASTSKENQGIGRTGGKKRVEDGIVGALAGIQTGLRRQLAAHLKKALDGAKSAPPLIAWLWEPALKGEASGSAQVPIPVLHLSKDPKDKEQAQAAAMALLNQPKPRVPVPPLASRDPLEEELWRLVVDREKLRAALEMEGLPAPSPGLFKSDITAPAVKKVAPLKDSPFVNKTKGARQQEKAQPETVLGYGEPQEVFTLPGELLEAVCVNSVDPRQMVVATNRKGLVYADIRPGSNVPGVASAPASFAPMGDTLWGKSLWPSRGWPGTGPKTESPPWVNTPPTSSQVGSYVSGMSVQGGVAGLGVGAGTWALGWDIDEGSAEDPIPLLDSVTSRTLAAHPLRPFFLVGSNNTHTYLWEFGREKATATYGVLPAVSGPPPYVIPSVERVRFDRYGHRFATAANDGTVSTWRLEVGGRSQTRADETRQCFSRHCSDLAFVGASGSVIAAAGLSPTNENVVLWDTLAPPTSSRAAVHCHDGGARCLAVIDSAAGGYPLIVSGGRAGDIIVHDFRYVASGRGGHRATGNGHSLANGSPGGQARRPPVGSNRESASARGGEDLGGSTSDRTVWSIPRAHPGGVHTIESVPGTSMFLTGGKDGEVKLWDAASSRLVHTWERAHDKRTFLNARGGGAVMQVAVTLVLPLQDGMLSCGADGIVKLYPQQEIAFAKSSA